jgi:putative tricarboxylic transport membrane protein
MTGLPGTGRRPDGAAFIIAVLLGGLGALLIREGGLFPDRAGYAGVGPGGMPFLVGWVLVGLALWTAIDGLRGKPDARDPVEIVPVLWILGGLALQIALLKPAGFMVASGLLFACTAFAFGKRKLYITIPVGMAFALGVYGIFDALLQLNLPGGPLETLIFGG